MATTTQNKRQIATVFMVVLCMLLCGINTAAAQNVSDFMTIPIPDDIKVDRFGNVWVNYSTGTSPDTFHLAKITPAGILTNVITEPFTLGQFGINDSTIWISSWDVDSVYKYTHTGKRIDAVHMNAPTDILLEPDGTWYIAQNQNSRILRYLPDNTSTVIASGAPLNNNLALARDEQGTFYTCNLNDGRVIKVHPNTGEKTVIASLPTSSPYSLGFLDYRQGYVYVPSFRNCIYKVDTAGTGYTVFAGREGFAGDVNGDAATALFKGPTGVAFSVTGDTLFFTDAGNNKIKMITGFNTVGVQEQQEPDAELSLYPNPAEQLITIHTGAPHDALQMLVIYTAQGREVRRFSVNEHTAVLQYNVAQLSPGMYLVEATTTKGKRLRTHFVKSNQNTGEQKLK